MLYDFQVCYGGKCQTRSCVSDRDCELGGSEAEPPQESNSLQCHPDGHCTGKKIVGLIFHAIFFKKSNEIPF